MARDQEQNEKRNPSRRSKRKQASVKERTHNLVRMDRPNALERVPSNAPTMAIAPSDYEHIFHEGPTTNAATNQMPTISPPVVNSPPQNQPLPPPPPPPLPPPPPPQPPAITINEPEFGHLRYAQEVQVSPDGYTLLGQVPPAEPIRRPALPPYVVRSSNQFSRAALARVARYLASRADPPLR